MKNIYIDYDSVLNNLCTAWLKWVSLKYGGNPTTEDIIHWDWLEEQYGKDVNDFWKQKEIYADDIVMPREGAIDFINRIKKYKSVVILTSTYPGTETAKNNHIKRHFGKIKIINESNKFIHTGSGILVDDRPQTVADHCIHNNQVGVVFNYKGKQAWSRLNSMNLKGLHAKLKIAKTFEEVEKIIGIKG